MTYEKAFERLKTNSCTLQLLRRKSNKYLELLEKYKDSVEWWEHHNGRFYGMGQWNEYMDDVIIRINPNTIFK